MTLATFIGAGGLGYLVFSGIQTVNNIMILSGAAQAYILALLVDYIFSKVEKSVMSKYSSQKSSKEKRKNNHIGLKICTAIVVVAILSISIGQNFNKDNTIVVGSKDYTEGLILGNMYVDLLEEYTDYNIERKLNMGTTVLLNSIVSGEVDMYADYTGTIFINLMKEETIGDADEVYNRVKDNLDKEYNIKVLDSIGFNNTYTLAMEQDVAKEYGIETYSDLTKYSNELVFSPTLAFQNRDDGLPGLQKYYNMEFKDVKSMDGV